ncbi:MAG: thiamine-phosphate synthase family protein, partial [Candidatus Hydrothermarchaeota archaeon]|nr:thiamine-phosphate synthase family protein [Candidatus Hydrothermarchaeota archaeon]
TSAIKNAYAPGKGARVINPTGEMLRNSEKFRVISELKEAVNEMKELDGFYRLVPQVGTNIAYALAGARNLSDVAGISGRIIRIKEQVKAIGEAEFGASKHVASIVLAAMKFDGNARSAMNIRYSKEILAACKHFKISSFSRKEEPRGVSTMEWGTAQAIKKLGNSDRKLARIAKLVRKSGALANANAIFLTEGVPDIIYDLGSVGKEPMIRILGKNPREVLDKLRQILEMQNV